MSDRDFKHRPSADFESVDRLSREDARDEIQALREAIEYHDHLYYVENTPEISDAVYDKLFQRLEELERAFPEFDSENSPTRRVGAPPLDELPRVEHGAPMLSLNAVYESQELDSFVEMLHEQPSDDTTTMVAEPKFHGVSVEVIYEHGSYARAATRGDGRRGDEDRPHRAEEHRRLRAERLPGRRAGAGPLPAADLGRSGGRVRWLAVGQEDSRQRKGGRAAGR